jgi:hypothetical protein
LRKCIRWESSREKHDAAIQFDAGLINGRGSELFAGTGQEVERSWQITDAVPKPTPIVDGACRLGLLASEVEEVESFAQVRIGKAGRPDLRMDERAGHQRSCRPDMVTVPPENWYAAAKGIERLFVSTEIPEDHGTSHRDTRSGDAARQFKGSLELNESVLRPACKSESRREGCEDISVSVSAFVRSSDAGGTTEMAEGDGDVAAFPLGEAKGLPDDRWRTECVLSLQQ